MGFFAKSFYSNCDKFVMYNSENETPIVSFEMSSGVCHPNASCCQRNPQHLLLQTLLLIQEFLSKESKMLHRCVSAPKGREDTFRGENFLSRKK